MDLSLVPLEDLLDELGNRYIFVMASIRPEDGVNKIEIHESDKGEFLEKAGLIACLQNDWFYQFEGEDDEET